MIEAYTFGKIVINGVTYTSDLKIINGEVIPNWWRKSGHNVIVDDIQDILKAKPNILVLGKGSPGQMSSTRALQEVLEKEGIKLLEEPSSDAVKTLISFLEKGKPFVRGFI